MPVDRIYKVCTKECFEQSRAVGRFIGMPIDIADKYLHFSSAEQLAETIRLYFAGQTDLVLFSVATASCGEALKWEPSRGGALFPHLFADLPMSSVIESIVFDVSQDGRVALPEWVK